jgi:hypothetical protein
VQRDQQVQRAVGSTKVEHGQVDNGKNDKVDNILQERKLMQENRRQMA